MLQPALVTMLALPEAEMELPPRRAEQAESAVLGAPRKSFDLFSEPEEGGALAGIGWSLRKSLQAVTWPSCTVVT